MIAAQSQTTPAPGSSDVTALPHDIRKCLRDFRRRVWIIKAAEGLFVGLFGLVFSCVVVFGLDRFCETPAVVRMLILGLGAAGLLLLLPRQLYRWLWRTRQLHQVAGLIRRRYPALGDQLLGVVELAGRRIDPGSSLVLAEAAIRQVAELVRQRDLTDAVPTPRHRIYGLIAAIPSLVFVLILLLVPAAGFNSLARWLMPWRDIERYTFAQLESFPPVIIAPYGEEFSVAATLRPETPWAPAEGQVQLEGQPALSASLTGQAYRFLIPPQTLDTRLELKVGDARGLAAVQTASRPELLALTAAIRLPDYLQYSTEIRTDVRGGRISVVKGAVATLQADVSRRLASAHVAGRETTVSGSRIPVQPMTVQESMDVEFRWLDELGLTARTPFRLKVQALDDAGPSVFCEPQDAPAVILSTDVITFKVRGEDDFGVREVGLEWSGMPETAGQTQPDRGEKTVARGVPEATVLQGVATFCAASDQVRPQRLQLRAWALDYWPDRERVYSPVCLVQVLSPEEHAVWVAEQLRRWAGRADDVYEEEMRLHDANRGLRAQDQEDLRLPEMRRQLEEQAAAEDANAKRLSALTDHGERLLEQAVRNRELQVGQLETWAAVLQELEQIAANRMPSVADLLDKASAAPDSTPDAKSTGDPAAVAPANDQQGSVVGSIREQSPAPGDSAKQPETPSPTAPTVPQIVDRESGFIPPERETEEDSAAKTASRPDEPPGTVSPPGTLSLPGTQLAGGPKRGGKKPPDSQPEDDVDTAIQQQAELLAEFQAVRSDLQEILDDLENSTFVKRLKAAARRQLEIADQLSRTLQQGFGVAAESPGSGQQQTAQAADAEEKQSRGVQTIQSDLAAWLARRNDSRLRRVLDEMTRTDIVLKLAAISRCIRQNRTGQAISHAEFWADTMDRWAEELVPGTASGADKGGKGSSLPPSIVLEVMRILEGEIDLREETRALDQAREVAEAAAFSEKAAGQSRLQVDLHSRVVQVITDIRSIPEGTEKFEAELEIIADAGLAMADAARILRKPDPGAAAIAAETEAIELLLQAKRSGPEGGGGGGGTTPGGGGTGSTDRAALALSGAASDNEARIDEREPGQAIGVTAGQLPEEFRDGLDAFFSAVEDSP